MLTLLLPTRGQGQSPYFNQALDSVLTQREHQWKLLVIDGGETPIPLPEDPRISRLCIWPEKGVGVALNRAMATVSSPFVAVLHDDDLLDRQAVSRLLEALQNQTEVDYFHSGRRFIDDQGRLISPYIEPRACIQPGSFLEGAGVKHLHCWRVESALKAGGIDESLQLHGADDYDFPWRLAEMGCRFQALNHCLYYQRDHRSAERLTTHVPLETQLDLERRTLEKHQIEPERIQSELIARENGYLRQALFRDEADRQSKLSQGFCAQTGWREDPCPGKQWKGPWWKRLFQF
ncbi:glycosyltransferase [bacterium]|nr:glycosyltransferase [bacterium]